MYNINVKELLPHAIPNHINVHVTKCSKVVNKKSKALHIDHFQEIKIQQPADLRK